MEKQKNTSLDSISITRKHGQSQCACYRTHQWSLSQQMSFLLRLAMSFVWINFRYSANEFSGASKWIRSCEWTWTWTLSLPCSCVYTLYIYGVTSPISDAHKCFSIHSCFTKSVCKADGCINVWSSYTHIYSRLTSVLLQLKGLFNEEYYGQYWTHLFSQCNAYSTCECCRKK